jgi:hypothetical protein
METNNMPPPGDIPAAASEAFKHVQTIVTRLASNSFLLKGWMITVVAGSFVLSNKISELNVLVALIPVVAFWFLDAYYLRQERLFRSFANWIAKNPYASFSGLFTFDITPFKSEHTCCKAFFSASVLCFYVPMVVLILLVAWIQC